MCKSSLDSKFRLGYSFPWLHFASDSEKKNPKWIWNGAFSCRIKGTEFRIIYQDENQAEVSFTRNWDPSLEGKAVPLNIDKRWLVHKYSNSATHQFISSGQGKHVSHSKCFCAGSLFSVVHPDSTPMESMSIRKDGLVLAWARRGWLSSCGKTSKPSYWYFFLFTECLNVAIYEAIYALQVSLHGIGWRQAENHANARWPIASPRPAISIPWGCAPCGPNKSWSQRGGKMAWQR
jgi:hypothetical protein